MRGGCDSDVIPPLASQDPVPATFDSDVLYCPAGFDEINRRRRDAFGRLNQDIVRHESAPLNALTLLQRALRARCLEPTRNGTGKTRRLTGLGKNQLGKLQALSGEHDSEFRFISRTTKSRACDTCAACCR